jgi:hypothetical protein
MKSSSAFSQQSDFARNAMAVQGRPPTVNVINITRRPEGGIVNVEMKRQEGLSQPSVRSLPQQNIGALNSPAVVMGQRSIMLPTNVTGSRNTAVKPSAPLQSSKYQNQNMGFQQTTDQQILMQQLQMGFSIPGQFYSRSGAPEVNQQPSSNCEDMYAVYNRLAESTPAMPPSYNTRLHVKPASFQIPPVDSASNNKSQAGNHIGKLPGRAEERYSSDSIPASHFVTEVPLGFLGKDSTSSNNMLGDATSIRGNGLPVGTQLISRLPGLQYDVIPPRSDGPSEAEKKLAALTLKLENEMKTAAAARQFYDSSLAVPVRQKSPPPYFGPHITTNFHTVPLKVSVSSSGVSISSDVPGSTVHQVKSLSESSSCSLSDEDQRVAGTFRGPEPADNEKAGEYYGKLQKEFFTLYVVNGSFIQNIY